MFEKKRWFEENDKKQQLFAVRNTDSPTLNLNLSESNRARAKLQTSGDEKNPQFEPQKEIFPKIFKNCWENAKIKSFFY